MLDWLLSMDVRQLGGLILAVGGLGYVARRPLVAIAKRFWPNGDAEGRVDHGDLDAVVRLEGRAMRRSAPDLGKAVGEVEKHFFDEGENAT